MSMDEQAKHEANKRLAIALGWTVRQATHELTGDGWFAFNPEGEQVLYMWRVGAFSVALFEDEAWQHVPNFYASVDASLDALPEHLDVGLGHDGDGVHWAYIHRGGGAWVQTFQGNGATRAEALAEALLAWKTGQEGDAP
jgi:hypothetical protein